MKGVASEKKTLNIVPNKQEEDVKRELFIAIANFES